MNRRQRRTKVDGGRNDGCRRRVLPLHAAAARTRPTSTGELPRKRGRRKEKTVRGRGELVQGFHIANILLHHSSRIFVTRKLRSS
ncbi:hypothetical protein AAHA92_14449 [Salvia divinorum]|uniref:Uncharacterized protein n=1 Tax=Salvia divinorum TaxID=28513 RepID=A0ABD1HEX6_SALDI